MQRPNILYIHSHDTGRYVQPYGYAVPTPNIQRLAEEGVLFRQAFCASPTCSPSRACLLTGQYAHNNGMLGLAHRGFSLNDYSHHLLHTLRRVGYVSALAGVLMAARLGAVRASTAEGFELDIITVVLLGGVSIFGGVGTMVGTLIGALIIGVMNNGMNMLSVPYFYQLIVKVLVILVAVWLDVRAKRAKQ